MSFHTKLLLLFAPSVLGLVQPNGVGRLPALGWNSWNAFNCDIDEDKFLTAAQKLKDLGLADAGYEYVNIDDCWSNKDGRDSTTGRLLPNTTRFPDGINGTAAQVHAMGLKIGIYSSAGTYACAGYPASIGNETIDAQTWAEWGIDYLKYDNCNIPSNWSDTCNACHPDYIDSQYLTANGTCLPNTPNLCPSGYDYSQSNTAERYRIMGEALQAQNRTILYSLCEWGTAGVETWGNNTAASWRMSNDINTSWARILNILNQNVFNLDYVNFWGHPDPDMLEVGNGLTLQQSRTHFALWAAMKSPLLIGTDLDNLDNDTLSILKNPYLLAFNQDDTIGEPAKPYSWGTNPDWTFNDTFPAEFWSGNSSNGTLVLLFNPYPNTLVKEAVWADIPGLMANGTYKVVEVWNDVDLGCQSGGIGLEVNANDTAVFLIQDCPSATSNLI
ncbi:alpha-galactosidase 1 [Talaromyces proteolyticus]|uniref:Alpha-galactosidase n=1 Tax=Talaromyces proteolyticus TaxID=1131652 RepID=A0AAD4KHT0_9EURO|nr:alpha-galactosidase 1 [Talaromyces proteolyticus]KAH8692767.1 alpha-galactosidase 1 [Talaromyces proteolyticus]